MAKVLLFEWTAGGHRPIYVRRLVEALRPSADVVLAFPQTTLDAVGDLGVETLSLGDARPRLPGRLRRSAVLTEEAARFRRAARGMDHAVHLFADHILFRLIVEPMFPCRTSLVLYYPRAHYKAAYATDLSST